MIKFIQQVFRRTPLGWLQLSHQKSRLLVALSGIAFADILMFMQFGFERSLYDSNTKFNRVLRADIILISPKAQFTQNLSTFSRRRLYQAASFSGVKSAEALYINSMTWRNPQTREETSIQVIGLNPQHDAFNIPEIKNQLELIKLPNTFLFDRNSKGEYQEVIDRLQQGETVTTETGKHTIHLTGLFELGSSFAADGNLIASDQSFLRLFPQRDASSISLGLIYIEQGYDLQQVVTALKAFLPNDVNVLTREEYVLFDENYWRKKSAIGFIFSMGVTMSFVVGVVIVYQVLSTDVNAHLKEYATFKAMGYTNFYLLGVIFEETIILAILGFIPGFIIPLGLYQIARQATNLPIYMTLSRAISVLLLTIVMCLFSGAIATRQVQSADPADMF